MNYKSYAMVWNANTRMQTLVSILPGICPQLRTRIFCFVLSLGHEKHMENRCF